MKFEVVSGLKHNFIILPFWKSEFPHGYHCIKVIVLAGLRFFLEAPGMDLFSGVFHLVEAAAFLGLWSNPQSQQ